MKTLRTLGDETFSPTFAVYGDFGLENARSLPYLVKDTLEGGIDAVLHCGDIAYDLFEVLLNHKLCTCAYMIAGAGICTAVPIRVQS